MQNQSVDIVNSAKESSEDISAISTYIEVTSKAQQYVKKLGNSAQKPVDQLATQLNKIREKQKRFQRNVPTSSDQLLDLIGLTRGKGGDTYNELRKIILQAAAKCEPEVKNIIQEESLKAIGCTQEQTYSGISLNDLTLTTLPQLPFSACTTIPVQSLDIITLASGMLKLEINNPIAKILYEVNNPSVTPGVYRPYGGKDPFPMNRTLGILTQTPNFSFYQNVGKVYQGASGQPLMDIAYTNVNEYGVTGDYYKIALVNRSGSTVSQTGVVTGSTANKIHLWMNDYYRTIKMFDTADVGAQICQILQGFMSTKLGMGSGEISKQSAFYNIARRILGLCFDSRTEIDVSGIAKIAELDGVDDEFFEQTEVDLRNIEQSISNIQQGVTQFVSCDNVKLPVNFENLTEQFIDFKANSSGQTVDEQVATLENIINSITNNPDWRLYTNSNLLAGAEGEEAKNIIQQIGLAVSAAALSPKVLLPMFVMYNYIQSQAANTYYSAVTSASTFSITGLTNASGQINNIVTDGVSFLKIFKKFSINTISRIGAIFVRELFNILKKDILRLTNIALREIQKSQYSLQTQRNLRLITIASSLTAIAVRGFFDARKCKSLLDEIKDILSVINGANATSAKPRQKISALAMLFSDFLPGESPERATINGIKYLQQFGIPTYTLPDGTPNLMLLYGLAFQRGDKLEMNRNGVSDTVLIPGKTGNPPRFVTVPR